MAVFDKNVRAVLGYAGSLCDHTVKREILVSLVKDKARYNGEDVIDKFYPNAYSLLANEKDACNYLLSIPLLKKLYDIFSARRWERFSTFSGRPDENGLEKIKRKIESFR